MIGNPTNAADSPLLLSIQLLMQRLGGMTLPISAHSTEDIEAGFATMARESAGAVIILTDTYLILQRQLIASLRSSIGCRP